MHIKKINITYLAIILFAAALLLVSIPVVRVIQSNPAIPGIEHYTNVNSGLFFLDFLLQYIPQFILAISFPLLFALASLLLFAKLVSRHVEHENQIYYSLIILMLTPAFIGIHIGLSIYQFILFFGLLFALLYDMDTKWFYVPLAILYLLDPLLGLGIILGTIIWSSIKDEGKTALTLAFFLMGLIIVSNFLSLSSLSITQLHFSINDIFSFFNAKYGYSLFLFVLGFGSLFFEKKRIIPLIIIFGSMFYEPLRILGLFILSFYAAKHFYKLQQREWNISFISTLTLVLFVCILFFGSITYVKETIQDTPHKAHVDALIYLHENGAQANVLSSYELSEFITFMTGQQTIFKQEYFYSQQYQYISEQFKQEDIGYIFIDNSMRSGKIWQHDEEGLLFLLKYNDNFKKIYEIEGIEIYYFAPWRE